jgi:hypothetical protein
MLRLRRRWIDFMGSLDTGIVHPLRQLFKFHRNRSPHTFFVNARFQEIQVSMSISESLKIPTQPTCEYLASPLRMGCQKAFPFLRTLIVPEDSCGKEHANAKNLYY